MNRHTPINFPFSDTKNRISDQIYFYIDLKTTETDLYSRFSCKKYLILCKSCLYSYKKCFNFYKSYINSYKSYLNSAKSYFNSAKSYFKSGKSYLKSGKKYLRVDLKKWYPENDCIASYLNSLFSNVNNWLFTSYLIFHRSQLSNISPLIT